jgi:hypothetical protein
MQLSIMEEILILITFLLVVTDRENEITIHILIYIVVQTHAVINKLLPVSIDLVSQTEYKQKWLI